MPDGYLPDIQDGFFQLKLQEGFLAGMDHQAGKAFAFISHAGDFKLMPANRDLLQAEITF